MNVDEIDKKIEELQAQRAKALQAEQEKMRQKNFEEARDILGRLVADVSRIYELGYCPPRLLTALSDGQGKFNPGMYIKRPKAPRHTE